MAEPTIPYGRMGDATFTTRDVLSLNREATAADKAKKLALGRSTRNALYDISIER